MLSLFAFVGYATAAVLFLVLAGLLVRGQTGTSQSRLILLAALVNAVWAALLAWQLGHPNVNPDVLFALEVLRAGVWLAFLISVLSLAGKQLLPSSLKFVAYAGPVGVLLLGILPFGIVQGSASVFVTGSIMLSIIGLVILERIYRNADPAARRPIGYLTLAIAGLFGYDLVMFSTSVLIGHISPSLWAARGVANAAVVPFLILAAQQNREWRVDIFVSRQVAYFSLTLFGAGIYLILMAIGGYYVKEYGGSLGTALVVILIFVTALVFAGLLLSDRLRRQVRVFFSKHFFRNRYDYRDEWRKLSATLYDSADTRSLGERSVEAAARIMNSVSGYLMLQREGDRSALLPYASWRCDLPENIQVGSSDPLVDYLETSNWIIDTGQYREDPDFYGGLVLPDWLLPNGHQQIVVPLLLKNQLVGILVLDQETQVSLTYEDTDLLKIVGRQVAGLLGQELDAEKLAEGRQFQAYSRLTAFLMHDLKNLAAQQSLVVKNAAKHKRNPDFVDDAFLTIEHSVTRMNRLIAQLAEHGRKEKRKKVSVSDVLDGVIELVNDRKPLPVAECETGAIDVLADREKLAAIFTHLLRNAQDTCSEDGRIQVLVKASLSEVEISVTDNGEGMDDAFIREKLFKPFVSTKGAGGMGIGAYQVREYVKELKGRLVVESSPGQGTTVTICLPRDSNEQRLV